MSRKNIEKQKIADAINKVSTTPIKLKNQLSPADLLDLKLALDPINNMITSELTKAFIRNLGTIRIKGQKMISTADINKLLSDFENEDMNRPGFDFVDKKHNLLAEVKANIPCNNNGKRYGSNQINEIQKDINSLMNGKSTSTENTMDYYKFLILLNYDNNTIEAVKNLLKRRKSKDTVRLYDSQTVIDKKDCVYVVLITLQ